MVIESVTTSYRQQEAAIAKYNQQHCSSKRTIIKSLKDGAAPKKNQWYIDV